MTVLLSASNLGCEIGGRRLFEGLTFDLRPGEALVVRGANGSGKSSLLRILAGLRRADDGASALRAPAHYLGHALGLKPMLTAADHLRHWRGLAASSETAAIPAEVAAFADLPVAALSRGQAQQVALARLATDARPIWLLDEPTGPLDAEASCAFADRLAAHLEDGGAAVVTTHRALRLRGDTRELRL